MDIKEQRRKLFESTTILPTGVVWNAESSSYEGPNYWLAEYAWSAINRALDTVVIELPPRRSFDTPKEDSRYWEDSGFNSALVLTKAAIKATGLGIKVK